MGLEKKMEITIQGLSCRLKDLGFFVRIMSINYIGIISG